MTVPRLWPRMQHAGVRLIGLSFATTLPLVDSAGQGTHRADGQQDPRRLFGTATPICPPDHGVREKSTPYG